MQCVVLCVTNDVVSVDPSVRCCGAQDQTSSELNRVSDAQIGWTLDETLHELQGSTPLMKVLVNEADQADSSISGPMQPAIGDPGRSQAASCRLRPEACKTKHPAGHMVLSAGPSPPAPADGAIAAPWSAPLLKDVLTVESLGEDLDVATLGVALACSALLDEHTVPGWLPALLDE